MNAELKAVVDGVDKGSRGYKAEYFRDGNFTVCVLTVASVISVGVSKRNPNEDVDIPERGQRIALARAAKNFIGDQEVKKKGK